MDDSLLEFYDVKKRLMTRIEPSLILVECKQKINQNAFIRRETKNTCGIMTLVLAGTFTVSNA